MLDIGFPELLLIALVILLVFGPERLPEVLRTVGSWVGYARRSFTSLKQEIEREVGADELRRDLHNARVLEEARKLREEFEKAGKGLHRSEKEIDAEVRRALTGATDDAPSLSEDDRAASGDDRSASGDERPASDGTPDDADKQRRNPGSAR